MQNIEIRRAAPGDADEIALVMREAFTQYSRLAGLGTIEALKESVEDIKKDISEKIVLVAFSGGRLVGSVRLKINGDGTAYLSRFGVSPDSQKNGIGKAIMNAVDKVMEENGVKSLMLHTALKVTPLIEFYKARGFCIESVSAERGYERALLIKEYPAAPTA